MNSPLVSVILPVYNRANFIARAIDSVLAQTYTNWELIIVDDGSTDDTPHILEQYSSRIILLKQANAGAYAARNCGLKHAHGELIAFIDSDDRWLPNRLASQMPLIERPNVGLVFGNGQRIDYSSGAPRPLTQTTFDMLPPSHGRVFRQLAYYNFIPQSSVLVKRECFDRVGEFATSSRTMADYAKWLQIAEHYEFAYVPDCIFEYGMHSKNLVDSPLKIFFAPAQVLQNQLEHTTEPVSKKEWHRALILFELFQSFHLWKQSVGRLRHALSLPGPLSPLQRLGILIGYIVNRLTMRWRRFKNR
ncbi:MAG: glycosyltransferase [Chloroflexi bacterium]|nr:glycosyltransferase [Chloroflexota bacterium]